MEKAVFKPAKNFVEFLWMVLWKIWCRFLQTFAFVEKVVFTQKYARVIHWVFHRFLDGIYSVFEEVLHNFHIAYYY